MTGTVSTIMGAFCGPGPAAAGHRETGLPSRPTVHSGLQILTGSMPHRGSAYGAPAVPRKGSFPAGERAIREGFLEVVMFEQAVEGQSDLDGQRGRRGHLGEEMGREGAEEQHRGWKKEK